jgi:hypothetical protein
MSLSSALCSCRFQHFRDVDHIHAMAAIPRRLKIVAIRTDTLVAAAESNVLPDVAVESPVSPLPPLSDERLTDTRVLAASVVPSTIAH